MNLKLKIYSALCATEIFEINNIKADTSDFGYMDDIDRDNAEEYCCGNMKFIPIMLEERVLNKYKITIQEYNEIVSQLVEGLSFGNCGWCS